MDLDFIRPTVTTLRFVRWTFDGFNCSQSLLARSIIDNNMCYLTSSIRFHVAGNGVLDQFDGIIQKECDKRAYIAVKTCDVFIRHLFGNGIDSAVIGAGRY